MRDITLTAKSKRSSLKRIGYWGDKTSNLSPHSFHIDYFSGIEKQNSLNNGGDIKNQRRVYFVSTSFYINISYNSLILTGVLVQVGSAIAVNLALLLSVYNLTHVCINLYQISSITLVHSFIIRSNGPLQSNFPWLYFLA